MYFFVAFFGYGWICGNFVSAVIMLAGYIFKITHPLSSQTVYSQFWSIPCLKEYRCTLAVITAVSRFSRHRLSQQRARRDFHSVQFKFCEEMFKMIDDPDSSLEFLCLQFKASQKPDVKQRSTQKIYADAYIADRAASKIQKRWRNSFRLQELATYKLKQRFETEILR